MSLREVLKFIFFLFCSITTVFVVSVAILFRFIVERQVVLNEAFFIQVLAIALVCSLPTLVLVHKEFAKRKEVILRNVIHFILTISLMLGLLNHFNWFNAIFVTTSLIVFSIIYTIAQILWNMQSKTLANEFNKRIDELRNGESATHSS